MRIDTIEVSDALDYLKSLPDESANCCVTSPPYWGLRDYKVDGQLGMERTPEEYVARMVAICAEVRRVLRKDGTLWINLGDTFWGGKGQNGLHIATRPQDGRLPGMKPKDLVGIPWLVAFALRNAGWYLRQDIIWAKPNPMPESVRDRCTKAHEYIFMLSKSARYFYDAEAVAEAGTHHGTDARPFGSAGGNRRDERRVYTPPTNGTIHRKGRTDKQRGHSRRHQGFNDRWDAMKRAGQCSGMRNKRSVWTVPTHPFSGAHFATFPPSLIEPCIKAGCPEGGVVLDPFMGAGTTALVANRLGRHFMGCDLNPEYVEMARQRVLRDAPLFNTRKEKP